MPQRKETEMKEHNGPSIICAVLLFGAVLVSPAFAEKQKVDEAELARTNASVTGAYVKNQVAGVDKDAVRWETEQTGSTLDKEAVVLSPDAQTMQGHGLNLNSNGQETSNLYFGGSNSNMTGGIISIKH
jgi:hypothetical protein